MWDKADIRIPFKLSAVMVSQSSTPENAIGSVSIENYDFPADIPVVFIDGERIEEALKARKWGSIESSISNVAVGFFPQGNGFYGWPHVSVKASPSKILQGHNVFGTENIRAGVEQMLTNLMQAFPKIAADLDFSDADVRYLDCTYSAFIESDYKRNQVLKIMETLFTDKNQLNKYEGYLQGNKNSEYFRQKFYFKYQELFADLDKAKRKKDMQRVKILSNSALQEFAKGRMRFEATVGYRALERLGIPTKLPEFLKFHDWFLHVHKEPLSQYLWHKAFDKYLGQLEGHTMKNVDDDHIKLKIDAKYIRIKDNGKICKRKANAVFRTYRDIKLEGYHQLAKEKSSTFFDNVKLLTEIGISKAFLKSLDPQRVNENVIPLVQLIKIDFSRQRPDWYAEPTSGYVDSGRHLRAVG